MMRSYNWISVKQDLKTIVCNRCKKEHVMSITLPIPLNEYGAVLKAAGESFTEIHKDCKKPA